jgi:hypothetical protein
MRKGNQILQRDQLDRISTALQLPCDAVMWTMLMLGDVVGSFAAMT